jgi:hypothetical protein
MSGESPSSKVQIDRLRVMLDLGRVSSVADVFVNGEHARTLVWRPYQLDISRLIKPGENEIKILVTNTEANQRAVGTWIIFWQRSTSAEWKGQYN